MSDSYTARRFQILVHCSLITHDRYTHQKIKHSMLCMTGVNFRDITNIIFVILHLNVSRLSIFSSRCLFVCCCCFGGLVLTEKYSLFKDLKSNIRANKCIKTDLHNQEQVRNIPDEYFKFSNA